VVPGTSVWSGRCAQTSLWESKMCWTKLLVTLFLKFHNLLISFSSILDHPTSYCKRENWTQTAKWTYIRALRQNNEGSVEIKQRPIKMGGRAIHRTPPPKRTYFQTGIDRWSHLRKVLARRRLSHTYLMWLWSHNSFKISSLGLVLYGTKWLLWRPINKVLHFIRSVGLIRG
jgi:hypothetical protein